jgi:hypothetical protein
MRPVGLLEAKLVSNLYMGGVVENEVTAFFDLCFQKTKRPHFWWARVLCSQRLMFQISDAANQKQKSWGVILPVSNAVPLDAREGA